MFRRNFQRWLVAVWCRRMSIMLGATQQFLTRAVTGDVGSVGLEGSSMCGQYSPRVFLLFAIGSTLYSALAYYSFAVAIQQGAFQSTAFIVATVSVALRTFSLVLMWLIWCVKPGGIEAPVQWLTNRFFHCLPTMQAIFPVAIGLALALRIATTILVGDCSGQYETARIDGFCDPYYDHGGISLRLTVELIFNPILVAFLLRDTPIVAIVLSWALAVAVLVACSVVLDSADIAVATAGYVFCSVLIFFECSRQHQERERVLDELQRTVEENERLAKQEQAKELRAMMGNMAHDLKTPLTSFLNGLECILEVVTSWEALDRTGPALSFLSRARSNLTAIKKCVQGMKSTTSFMTLSINRCLDYTKTNAGVRLVPRPETVYLRGILEMPIKMMRDLQSGRDIVLYLPGDAICSHIITDKQWLLENLLCLLSNAVKFSMRGSVEVAVQLDPGEAGGSPVEAPAEGSPREESDARPVPLPLHHRTFSDTHVQQLRFQVQDAGIGLSDEAMQTLFNPFKQAQRLAGGTGLGLFSLAKRVEALHGHYGVSRRPDGAQGSRFWFTIPYRPDEMTAELNSESSPRSSTIISLSEESPLVLPAEALDATVPTESALQQHNRYSHLYASIGAQRPLSWNVLVVDDAPLIVRMTTMLLSRKGHTVTHAVNGAEALERILAGYEERSGGDEEQGSPPYDVVLMDLQMPIMDGPLAIRRLRAAEAQMREDAAALSSSSPRGSGYGGGVLGAGSSGEYKHAGSFGYDGEHPGTAYGGAADGYGEWDGNGEGDLEQGLSSRVGQGSQSSLHARFHQFVVAVSANSDQETVDDALMAGADTFMTKPFAYETFAAIFEEHYKFGTIADF